MLADALKRVADSPENAFVWLRLFALPKLCLRLPPRSGRKKQRCFVSTVWLSSLLSKARAGKWQELFDDAVRDAPKRGKTQGRESNRDIVRERVLALAEEGQYGKACKALGSLGLHPLTEEVATTLESKHPQRHEDLSEPLPAHDPGQDMLRFKWEDIAKALRGFPKGTAPGWSAMRVAHLLEAVAIPLGDNAGRISGPLTSLCNFLVQGKAPIEAAAWVAGAPLFPLKKKDGGVRPIAVGEVIRRLVSRAVCGMASFKARAEAIFTEVGQVGVGLRSGAEAAVQAVRQALEDRPGAAVLKIDFENAFNSALRRAILVQLQTHLPELTPWFRWCYSSPANLTCQGSVLPFKSCTGVQQGDPLGPFFFSLALLPTCSALKTLLPEALSVWYLDDGVVVGTCEQLQQAWDIIQATATQAGLSLNPAKCEVFSTQNTGTLLPHIPRSLPEGFDLLGSPIGSQSFCNNYILKRVARIEEGLKLLSRIDDPQVEMTLLRSCLGTPKFIFALRSAPPSHTSVAAQIFDRLIATSCEERFGISLSETTALQWHLPVSLGGMGIIRASDIATSAYLASALSARPLVQKLIGRHHGMPLGAQEAFHELRSKFGEALPASAESLSMLPAFAGKGDPQRFLTGLVHHANQKRLLASFPHDPREHLRCLAVARPGAGNWLEAVPNRALGTKYDSWEFFVLLKWWLGLRIMLAEPCPATSRDGNKCGAPLDVKGDHAVACPFGPTRIARHDGINRAWLHSVKSVGFHATPEAHVDPSSQRRSADTLVLEWSHGRSSAHDWVVTHALQASSTSRSQADPDYALAEAERSKNSYAKTACESRGVDFIPLAADTFGGFGPEAIKAITKVANQARLLQGADAPTTVRTLSQRLRIVVMRGVAHQLLRRLTHPGVEEFVESESESVHPLAPTLFDTHHPHDAFSPTSSLLVPPPR